MAREQPPPAEKPEGYTFERRYWNCNLSTVDVAKVETELPAARKAHIELGETVAVFGLGPIGLTALSYARLVEWDPQIMVPFLRWG